MQWRYLFITKSPRFRTPRKITSLFTLVFCCAPPSEAILDFVLPVPTFSACMAQVDRVAVQVDCVWVDGSYGFQMNKTPFPILCSASSHALTGSFLNMLHIRIFFWFLDAVPVKFKSNALHKHSVFKWVFMFHPVLSLLPKKPPPF